MTDAAKKLDQMLWKAFNLDPQERVDIVSSIVSELGITPEMVHDLINMTYKWQTSHTTGAVDALETLLEVAGVQTEVNDG